MTDTEIYGAGRSAEGCVASAGDLEDLNDVYSDGWGVYAHQTWYLQLSGNRFDNNDRGGLRIGYGDEGVITGNRFLRNGRDVTTGEGIYLHRANNYSIVGNHFYNPGQETSQDIGIYEAQYTGGSVISGNMFRGMGAGKKAISVCSNTTTKYDATDDQNNQFGDNAVETRTCP